MMSDFLPPLGITLGLAGLLGLFSCGWNTYYPFYLYSRIEVWLVYILLGRLA